MHKVTISINNYKLEYYYDLKKIYIDKKYDFNYNELLLIEKLRHSKNFNISDLDIKFISNEKIDYLDTTNYKKILSKKQKEVKYDFNTLKQAIGQNKYLTKDEKNFLYSLEKYFEMVKDYIDFNDLLINIKELKFRYGKNTEDNVAAEFTRYGFNKNTIDLYQSEEYLSNNINNSCDVTIIHELNHFLENIPTYSKLNEVQTDNFNLISYKYGEFYLFLFELFNELILFNYADYNINKFHDKIYEYQIPLAYILAEIVGFDIICKSKFSCSTKPLIEKLIGIGGEDNTFLLLNLIEQIDLIVDKFSEIDEDDDFSHEKIRKELKELVNKIYELLNMFYMCVYNEDINNNIDIMMISENTMYDRNIYSELIKNTFNLDMEELYVVYKNYLDDSTKTTYIDMMTNESINSDQIKEYIKSIRLK